MATYVTHANTFTKKKSKLFYAFALFFIALMAGLTAITSLGSFQTAYADDEDGNSIAAWIACGSFGGEGSMPHTIYRFNYTDDFHFTSESKSVASGGTEDVEGVLNSFVSVQKENSFKEINQAILGVNLDNGEVLGGFNDGTSVTAFDRFGLAGLNWTRYNGEWRYNYVDVCNQRTPTDLKLGVFYEDRLEPRSTYGDIEETKDVRTSQFGTGLASRFGEGMLNTAANWTFLITKGIVALAIALVNFSFTDFVHYFGVDDLLGADDGIYKVLFNGIYMPLIYIVMFFTAVTIFYKGIIKRQYRGALGVLFRSIVLFMIAVAISVAPLFFVTLPNNVATVGQSLLINTMSTSMAGGSGLCSIGHTASSEVDINPDAPTDVLNPEESQDLLTKASDTMRSIVDCQLWSTFLLKPWSLGQFGVDYNKLYAEGHIPSDAYGDPGEVIIDNEDMVGNAAVPMGGGTFIHNWALFHISTTTNVHSPYGMDPAEPVLSVYTNGVANDWYRIVDALSNYNEKETETAHDGVRASNNASEPIESIIYMEPDLSKTPTEYWANWVGGNSADRIGIAFTSIIGAAAGLFTVIVFGFLAVIYSFGIVLMMAVAPLFFLAGSWGDRGWEAFKGWGQTVLNLIIKRILIGVILILNLIILTTVLNMMSDQDYFWGVAVMAIVSVILWQFRHKIMDAVGGIFTFNFANSNLEGRAGQAFGRIKQETRIASQGAANIGVAAVVGGIAAKRNGASGVDGFKSGLKEELKNQAYRSNSNIVRQALLTSSSVKGDTLGASDICPGCGETIGGEIGSEGTVIVDSDYNYWHVRCAYEKHEILPDGWNEQDVNVTHDGKAKPKRKRIRKVVSNADTTITQKELKDAIEQTGFNLADESAGFMLGQAIGKDIREQGDTVPEPPAVLKPYLKENLTEIEHLLRRGDDESIQAVLYMYAQALVAHIYSVAPAYARDENGNEDLSSQSKHVSEVWSEMLRAY